MDAPVTHFFQIGIVACLVFSSFGSQIKAQDKALKFYLANADAAVVADLTEKPGSGIAHENRTFIQYECKFNIISVVKGKLRKDDAIRAAVTLPADESKQLLSGRRYVLFLVNGGSTDKDDWSTADLWFGLQEHRPWMDGQLTAAAEEERQKNRTMAVEDRRTTRAYRDR